MSTFEDRENKVLSFMEAVENEMLMKEEEDSFRNTVDYKLKALDKCEQDAKDFCYDKFFCKLYKDAVPLSDDYVNSHSEDLDSAFRDFMNTRCPKGIEFYVKEAIRKKNPAAKRIFEAIEDIVNDTYKDTAMNIEDISPDELVFKSQLGDVNKSNDPSSPDGKEHEIYKKLDVMGSDMGTDQISEVIKKNVGDTVKAEINAAKEKKEEMKRIEKELADDINITTEESVNNALALRDIGLEKDYVPSLFNSIMINKLNKLQPRYESGEFTAERIYDAIDMYTESASIETPKLEELALIESVKEYTALSVLKALKLESFDKYHVNDLAIEYATEKF